MDLLLFRHGHAESSIPPGGNDNDRKLTAAGRKGLEAAAPAWVSLAPAPTVIVVSPLVRARQTADILVAALGAATEHGQSPSLQIENALRPDGSTEHALEVLPETDSVWIVTHMPLVGDLVARLAVGTDRSSMPLTPGMGVWLELPGHHIGYGGRVVASLSQEAAEKVARGQ